MLTTGQACRMLGVSPNTLLKWIKTGRLKALNVSTANRPEYRIEPKDLQAFRDRITVNGSQGVA